MALSQYERTIRRFRRDLDAEDRLTRRRLALAYRQSLRTITARLANMPDDPTFRRLRLQDLARQIELEIARLSEQSAREIEQGQRRMLRLGPEQASGIVRAQAPELSASFTRLPTQAFESIVGATGDGTPLDRLLGRYGDIAASEAAKTLRDAIAQGTGPRETARQLRRIMGTAQWEAERVARTEQIRAYRESTRETYLANRDIVRGYKRLATLSTRTCPVCLALDGTFHETDEFLPSHPNCRCTTIPVLRGRDEPPINETGEEWFARQDEATQRAMLGRGKHELYQAGQLRLRDLVDEYDDKTWGRQVREIPLSRLARRPTPVPRAIPPRIDQSVTNRHATLTDNRVAPSAVSDLLKDSKTPDVYFHRTSEETAEAIYRDGIDFTRNSANTWQGGGFYMSRQSLPQYGAGEVRAVINSRNPFIGTAEDVEKVIDSFNVQPPEVELPGGAKAAFWMSNEQKLEALRQAWLDAGYDAIVMTSPNGNDVIVAIDAARTYLVDDALEASSDQQRRRRAA